LLVAGSRRRSQVSGSAIERSLEERGVPLRELHLVEDRSRLRRPHPLRCDLREISFSQPFGDRPREAAGKLVQQQ
jgi:hypothetical protein